MKLLVRGGAALFAAVFASLLIFDAQPLSAITNPSQQPAQQEQQEKKEPAGTPQKKETEKAQSEVVELSSTGVSSSNTVVVKSADTASAPLIAPQIYVATSYSRPGRGASGMGVRFGTIAADPKVLPYGTRVRLDAGQYSGEYVVTDAGTAIKGRKIDVWLPTFREACRFGRRNVKLTVLSYGGKKKRQK
jgi:3D (Asp-Asp-Asp) domain-containing protein